MKEEHFKTVDSLLFTGVKIMCQRCGCYFIMRQRFNYKEQLCEECESLGLQVNKPITEIDPSLGRIVPAEKRRVR